MKSGPVSRANSTAQTAVMNPWRQSLMLTRAKATKASAMTATMTARRPSRIETTAGSAWARP
jgi:hypothetical protein